MERRTFLTLLVGPPTLTLLAACGSDDVAAPGAPLPSVSDTPSPSVDDAQDFRLEFGYYGGFTTREVSFQMQPSLLVADGRVFTPGAVAAIYPGPLLPVDIVRTVTPAGVDALVDAVRDAGMLTDVTPEKVAADTIVAGDRRRRPEVPPRGLRLGSGRVAWRGARGHT